MREITQTESTSTIKKKDARITWVRTEILFLFASFGLPYLMGLFFYLTTRYSLLDIFSHEKVIRYALLGVVFFFTFTFFSWYLHYRKAEVFLHKSTKWILTTTVYFSFLLSPILANVLSPFIVPLVFCGLLIALLVDEKLAYIVNAVAPTLFFLCYYVLNPVTDMFSLVSSGLVQLLSGCFMLVTTKNRYTRLSFLLKCLAVGLLVSFPIAMISSLLRVDADVESAVISGIFASVSVLSSLAFFMVLTPLFEVAFGLYSNFRLEEICTSDAPLMERLAKEAPGTYNHSIAMATLAQDCAKAIGENASLAKAGACYHDVGKLYNPICFSENQTTYNPHDNYIPEVSVALITRHTKEGANLIRKQRLPEALAQIAQEHHGDQTVSYFLNKSIRMTDEKMNSDLFRYKGPRPSTKISGIIMIVDTVEAATRAQGINKDPVLFRAFIHKLISDKIDANQFSDCPLTFKDFTLIEETLLKSIPAIYHQRIKYNK